MVSNINTGKETHLPRVIKH